MAEPRAANAVHMAQNGLHWHNEQLLAAAKVNGMVKVLHTELFADPTSPFLITGGSADNANWYGRLRQYSPRLFIVVRMYHPKWWELNPEQYAEYTVRLLGRWVGHNYPEANLWADPYVGVVLANEQNIEQPDLAACSWFSIPGPTTAARVAASIDRYKRIAEWNTRAWDRIDQLVPERKALAVWSALAEGHDSKPDSPESEYQIPELRAAILRTDVLNAHPYSHKSARDNRPDNPGEANQYWGLLRPFRPAGYRDKLEPTKPHDIGGVVGLFPGMPFVFGECGTFAHDSPDAAAANLAAIQRLWQTAAATGRCLGGAVYIWHGGEDHRQNVIMHSPPMREGLAAMGPITAMVDWPTARPGRGYGGATMADGNKLATMLRERLGSRFVDVRSRYESNYGYADSNAMRYLAIHHSASGRETTLDAIEREHKGNGWAGIGYHAIVRLGMLYLVSSPDKERAHTYGRNREALGVCVTGNYAYGQLPADEDLAVLRSFVATLDEYYGHKKELVGHSQIALQGHGTACPGNALLTMLPTLRQGGNTDNTAALEAAIEAALEAEHTVRGLRFNPGASLWKAAGVPGGYLPSTNEIDIQVGGVTYIGQRYENGQQSRDRLYVYAPKANPGATYKFTRRG